MAPKREPDPIDKLTRMAEDIAREVRGMRAGVVRLSDRRKGGKANGKRR